MATAHHLNVILSKPQQVPTLGAGSILTGIGWLDPDRGVTDGANAGLAFGCS
jgi:hypothetical protein